MENHLPPSDQLQPFEISSQPIPKTNKWLVPLLLIVVLILLGTTSFFGYFYFQPEQAEQIPSQQTQQIPPVSIQSDVEGLPSTQYSWKEFSADTQSQNYLTLSEENHLYQASLISEILENEKLEPYSCLEINELVPIKDIQNSIDDPILNSGLEQLATYTYTSPTQTEDGTPLDPIKSKYEISLTSICKLSEASFIAIFLTTQALDERLSLIPQAHAAGGWLGDSHMAIIGLDKVEIYERFAFDAKLIDIYKDGKNLDLNRFGAYYNCGTLIATTSNHILIDCNSNIYSFNRQTEAFQELSICGFYTDPISFKTNWKICYDNSGESYLNSPVSQE